jgi:hypothetical protein
LTSDKKGAILLLLKRNTHQNKTTMKFQVTYTTCPTIGLHPDYQTENVRINALDADHAKLVAQINHYKKNGTGREILEKTINVLEIK